MLQDRLDGMRSALTTFPSGRILGWCVLIFIMYVLIALVIGLRTGFFKVEFLEAPLSTYIVVATVIFVHPAFIEESIFRGFLLPHASENRSTAFVIMSMILSLVLFVGMHPVNGLFFKTSAMDVYTNPVFLLLAALMGAACTLVYYISQSLWPCVVIHWITDVVWVLFLGGMKMLHK